MSERTQVKPKLGRAVDATARGVAEWLGFGCLWASDRRTVEAAR
jgi:hypothetical protein